VITLRCCGEEYHADEQHIGRKIMCRKCGRIMTIHAGATGLPSQPPYPSPPSAPQSTPIFAPLEWRRRLTGVAPAAIGGLVVLAIVLAWLVLRLPNREPVTEDKSTDRAPTSSPSPPIVPPQPEHTPARVAAALSTGTWIMKPRGAGGHGVLRIQNGSDLDSAVKLVTSPIPRRLVWFLYIRAHEEKEINGIGAGSYLLRFTLGQDWDSETQKFLQKAWFYQAGRQLDFEEIEPTEGERGQYTELTVTLHEMVGGNLPRVDISEALFNEGQ
jgi:hypothetical protein